MGLLALILLAGLLLRRWFVLIIVIRRLGDWNDLPDRLARAGHDVYPGQLLERHHC